MRHFIEADWPAPAHVKALTTCRNGGVSQVPYTSWNLASHVNDNAEHVAKNRSLLNERLALPKEPFWLEQVHGTDILTVDRHLSCHRQADGSYTREKHAVCVVMTADCLPLLICNRSGSEVAAVHAGWKGLAGGVIDAALRRFRSPAADLLVWLGPAIGPQAFEVGEEVRETFLKVAEKADVAFTPHGKQQYFANIYTLARQNLQACGVDAVFGGRHCTLNEESLFYSYRRDHNTGRMASLIWIE